MSTHYTRLLQFFQQFNKFYTHQFASLLKQTGLSMREVHVLLFLANQPQYDTARDITNLRGLAKSQVSQAVDLLSAEGLLARTPDQTDRRVIHLSITPEGQPLAKACQAVQAQCLQQLLMGMTPEQSTQFQFLLDIVLDNGVRLAEELSI